MSKKRSHLSAQPDKKSAKWDNVPQRRSPGINRNADNSSTLPINYDENRSENQTLRRAITTRVKWIWKPAKKRSIDQVVGRWLGKIATFAHDNPIIVISSILLLTLLLGCGLSVQPKSVNIMERYSPMNSRAVGVIDKYEVYFGYEPRTVVVSAHLDEPEANALTVKYLRQFLRLWTDFLSPLETTVNGRSVGIRDFCNLVPVGPNASSCLSMSLLGVFGWNDTYLNTLTNENIISAVNQEKLVDALGYDVDLNMVLGGRQYDSHGLIVGASSMTISIQIKATKRWKENSLADWWEIELMNSYKIFEATDDFDLKVDVMGQRIMSQSIIESQIEIYIVFGIGAALCAVYSVFVLTDLRAFDPVVSQINLIIYTVISIALSLIAGMGFVSYFGVPWSSELPLCMFLCLGLGFDDCYLLTYDYNRLSADLTSRVRVRRAMELSGTSITLTSITDCFAFVIGTGFGLTVNFPVMTNFCVYGASCIFFLWLYMIWIFSAFLGIDARRQVAGRWDLLCCFGGKNKMDSEEDTQITFDMENSLRRELFRRNRSFEADLHWKRKTGSFSYVREPPRSQRGGEHQKLHPWALFLDKIKESLAEDSYSGSTDSRASMSKEWTDIENLNEQYTPVNEDRVTEVEMHNLKVHIGHTQPHFDLARPTPTCGGDETPSDSSAINAHSIILMADEGENSAGSHSASDSSPKFKFRNPQPKRSSDIVNIRGENISSDSVEFGPGYKSKSQHKFLGIEGQSQGSFLSSVEQLKSKISQYSPRGKITPYLNSLGDQAEALDSSTSENVSTLDGSVDNPGSMVRRTDFLGYVIGQIVKIVLEFSIGPATIVFIFFLFGGFNLWVYVGNGTQYSFDLQDSLYRNTPAWDFFQMYDVEGRFTYDLLETWAGVVFDLDPYDNIKIFNSARDKVENIWGIAEMGGWVWSYEDYLYSTHNFTRISNTLSYSKLTHEKYIQYLIGFLNTSGSQYAGDVILVPDVDNSFSITTSRVWIKNLLSDSNTKINRLVNLRRACVYEDNQICYPFAEYYAYADGLLQVSNVVNLTAVTAMGCMFFIVWLALGNFFWAAFLTMVIALIAIDFLGLMFLVGSYDDQFKAMGVAMAFGFTVDFNMHLVHRFVHGEETLTPIERTVSAVRQVGGATFNGAFSTLLVILPAVFFPAVKIQQRGAQTFSIIIALGLAHSMFLVPALLMITGNMRVNQQGNDELMKEPLARGVPTTGGILVPSWYTVKEDSPCSSISVRSKRHKKRRRIHLQDAELKNVASKRVKRKKGGSRLTRSMDNAARKRGFKDVDAVVVKVWPENRAPGNVWNRSTSRYSESREKRCRMSTSSNKSRKNRLSYSIPSMELMDEDNEKSAEDICHAVYTPVTSNSLTIEGDEYKPSLTSPSHEISVDASHDSRGLLNLTEVHSNSTKQPDTFEDESSRSSIMNILAKARSSNALSYLLSEESNSNLDPIIRQLNKLSPRNTSPRIEDTSPCGFPYSSDLPYKNRLTHSPMTSFSQKRKQKFIEDSRSQGRKERAQRTFLEGRERNSFSRISSANSSRSGSMRNRNSTRSRHESRSKMRVSTESLSLDRDRRSREIGTEDIEAILRDSF